MSTCLLNNVLRLDPKLSAKLNPKLHTRTVIVHISVIILHNLMQFSRSRGELSSMILCDYKPSITITGMHSFRNTVCSNSQIVLTACTDSNEIGYNLVSSNSMPVLEYLTFTLKHKV